MKHSFLLATVSVPCLMLSAPAFAQSITLDSESESAVQTSTVDSGSAADFIIDSTGTIAVTDTSGFVAVTIDSNNDVQNDGTIQIEDSDNVVGVSIAPGLSSSLSGSGAINLIEDYTREDEDEDADLDGPLAIGSNRIAVLLDDGDALLGNLTFEAGSSIAVEGNDSAGVLLRAAVDGVFTLDGSITLLGDNAIGLAMEEAISGNVLISSSITASGENARAAIFQGDIGGALTIEGAVASTGFTSSSVSNYIAPDDIDEDTLDVDERRDADDLLDGGSALSLGGSVANGILINGAVDDFISEEDLEDETKDTIEDYDENRSSGTISTFSSAPAFRISPDIASDTDNDLVIGLVTEQVRDTTDDDEDDDTTEILAEFNYDYGLINRGSISANGLNIGFEGTGLQIAGSSDGAYQTIITGGILNTGSIDASAFEAGAIAIDLGAGANVGRLDNTGVISASIATSGLEKAIALSIGEGATLSTLTNDGVISATSFYGLESGAVAIQDASGTLSTLTNTGVIQAGYGATDDQDDESVAARAGERIAIDLRSEGSVTDVTLTQFRQTPTDDTNADDELDADDVIDPEINGNVYFAGGNDSFTSTDGEIFGDVDFGLGDATFSLTNTLYEGDTTFASGTHTVAFSNATITGALSFTNGTGSLALSNGAVVTTELTTSDSVLDISLNDAQLSLSANSQATLSGLTTSGSSLLGLALDPTAIDAAPLLTVNGAVVIGSDTLLSPGATRIASGDYAQTLIEADSIDFAGVLDSDTVIDTPFIYDLVLSIDDTADGQALNAALRLRSPEEIGLDINDTAAFDAVIEVASNDANLSAALASLTDEESFVTAYDSLLPQRTNAAARFLQAQNTAAYGALQDRLDVLTATPDASGGLWAQENISYINVGQNTEMSLPGYDGAGVGIALGGDRPLLGLDAVGILATFTYGEFEEKVGGNDPISNTGLGLGLYAYKSVGPINLFAAAAMSRVSFDSERSITFGDINTTSEGSWSGWSRSASVAISSDIALSKRTFVRPNISVDYFSLSENAYTEENVDGYGLNVSDAETSRLAATAGIAFGGIFVTGKTNRYGAGSGIDNRTYWRPEISAGVRSSLSETGYSATASFTGGTESFELISQEAYPTAIVGGAALNITSSTFSARIGYDLERSDEASTHVAAVTVRLAF